MTSDNNDSLEKFKEEFTALWSEDSKSSRAIFYFIHASLKRFNLDGELAASDILTEVYIRGRNRISRSSDATIPNVSAWIKMTALNVIREYSRKRKQESDGSKIEDRPVRDFLQSEKEKQPSSPEVSNVSSISLEVVMSEHAQIDLASQELAKLCEALNAYHIACGGNGLTLDDWETLVLNRVLVEV